MAVLFDAGNAAPVSCVARCARPGPWKSNWTAAPSNKKVRRPVSLAFFIGVYAAVIPSLYFLLPLYLQGNLKFSGAQIGLLYAVFNLNAILVAFPIGVSGDRYVARVLTRLGLTGCALCLWGMATLRSFWPFFLIFWGFGLSDALLGQSLNIMLFKGSGAEVHGRGASAISMPCGW